MKTILIALFVSVLTLEVSCQDASNKYARRIESPFMIDSTSTLFFPVQYGQGLVSGNKLATFGGYFANILVYDFTKDTYRSLFDRDTYVRRMVPYPGYSNSLFRQKHNKKWLFLMVKPSDTNANGRMDDHDASVAYAADARGENLRALTTVDVNVVNITFYDKQGFALLEMQRDSDGDKSFKPGDKIFYYQKIDLNDLSLGRPIESATHP